MVRLWIRRRLNLCNWLNVLVAVLLKRTRNNLIPFIFILILIIVIDFDDRLEIILHVKLMNVVVLLY